MAFQACRVQATVPNTLWWFSERRKLNFGTYIARTTADVCLLDFAVSQCGFCCVPADLLQCLPPGTPLVCADKVEPEVMAHILSKDSCGLRAWLTALPADSHPEVIVSSKACEWPCLSVPVALPGCVTLELEAVAPVSIDSDILPS